jgi:TetR/AcrR family transcriptional repressor of lmrAB and yxaGH operons
MVAAQGKHRQEIVRSAALLFRRQGYAATGTTQILAASGAPRGSLYHYFPRGKEQIGQAAVEHAGDVVTATLTRLIEREATPGAALREYARLLSAWLRDSGYRDGCPITTTLLELAPESETVSAAGRRAFADWTDTFSEALSAAGAEPEQARRLATLAVASLEGALVLARVHQDNNAMQVVANDVADLFDAATL